jgi:putative FmdB family regulatory protein
MPIYAYKCASCGHAKDVLQKMSDTPLSVCPSCGEASFQKQLTAAGFQLKGSGWYVTDFRNGNAGAPAAAKADGGEAKAEGSATSPAKTTDSAGSAPAAASAGTAAAAAPAAASAAPAAPASGSSSPSSAS